MLPLQFSICSRSELFPFANYIGFDESWMEHTHVWRMQFFCHLIFLAMCLTRRFSQGDWVHSVWWKVIHRDRRWLARARARQSCSVLLRQCNPLNLRADQSIRYPARQQLWKFLCCNARPSALCGSVYHFHIFMNMLHVSFLRRPSPPLMRGGAEDAVFPSLPALCAFPSSIYVRISANRSTQLN